MLTCRDVSEKTNDYLDGTLGFWPRANLRMHLLLCKHCRAFVGQMQATIHFIDRHGYTLMPEEQPSKPLVEAFCQRAAAGGRPRPRPPE